MNSTVHYFTLAAARRSNKEKLDAAIRDGLELGAKTLGHELAWMALTNHPALAQKSQRKAA